LKLISATIFFVSACERKVQGVQEVQEVQGQRVRV